jgi:hypothetical protein
METTYLSVLQMWPMYSREAPSRQVLLPVPAVATYYHAYGPTHGPVDEKDRLCTAALHCTLGIANYSASSLCSSATRAPPAHSLAACLLACFLWLPRRCGCTLFIYVEIYFMLILVLKYYKKKTLFYGWKIVQLTPYTSSACHKLNCVCHAGRSCCMRGSLVHRALRLFSFYPPGRWISRSRRSRRRHSIKTVVDRYMIHAWSVVLARYVLTAGC